MSLGPARPAGAGAARARGGAAAWADYGRALAGVRDRRDDAVKALRCAEAISPLDVHRNPLTRDTIAALLARTCHDAVGRELRHSKHSPPI